MAVWPKNIITQILQSLYNFISTLASKLVVKNELSRKFKMVHGLDLLHLGRKNNRTISEKQRQQNKSGKAKNSSNSLSGSLNGEWERMHDFMCTSCAIGMIFIYYSINWWNN